MKETQKIVCSEENRVVDVELNVRLVVENTALAKHAIRNSPYDKSRGAFTVCDFGGGGGNASLPLMEAIIDEVKEVHGEDTEVCILYEDTPDNDFKALFDRANENLVGAADCSLRHQSVFVLASGTTFYQQCCPSGSLHFGYTTLSIHLLSKRMPLLSDSISVHYTSNTQLRQMYARQAAQDWMTFLTARAKELAPGGNLLLSTLAIDEEGQHYGSTKNIKCHYYQTINNILKDMVAEGLITQAEFLNTNFHDYMRTEAELRAPLEDKDSVAYQLGLRLQSCSMTLVRNPYHQYWMKHGNKDDPEACRAHARRYVPSVSIWTSHFLHSGLDDGRTDEDKDRLVQDMWKRYEDLVAANPQDHGTDWVGATLHITKINTSS